MADKTAPSKDTGASPAAPTAAAAAASPATSAAPVQTKPAVPFVRSAGDARRPQLVRVGGKGTVMPPQRPGPQPLKGTFDAYALAAKLPTWLAAATKAHRGWVGNSEMEQAEFDRAVKEAGSVRVSAR